LAGVVPMANLLLTSRGLHALPTFVERHAPGRRALHIPTAAEPYRGARILDEIRAEFAASMSEMTDVWMTEDDDPAMLDDVDLVIMGGGDPFHLLDRLRTTGWGDAITSAVRAGLAYVGMSAGSLVAGPTLEPCTVTSPHAPRPGLDLTALNLVEVVALPHHDQPGRAERHSEALARFGGDLNIVALSDDQALVVVDGVADLVPS